MDYLLDTLPIVYYSIIKTTTILKKFRFADSGKFGVHHSPAPLWFHPWLRYFKRVTCYLLNLMFMTCNSR